MTTEQIAELRRLTDVISWTAGDIEALAPLLPRLLIERQRLLDGCKQSLMQLDGPAPLNKDEWIDFLHEVVEEAET